MPHFFVPDRKTFYYRSHVPERLQRLLNGRTQIWRSLKCTDKEEARLRSVAWEHRLLQLYRTLKRHGEHMTNEQRKALVSHWLDAELEYAEDCRATAGVISDEKRDGYLEVLAMLQQD